MTETIIVVAVIAVIVASAILYIVKEKKKGAKCIGCPHSNSCSSKCNCSDKSKSGT